MGVAIESTFASITGAIKNSTQRIALANGAILSIYLRWLFTYMLLANHKYIFGDMENWSCGKR